MFLNPSNERNHHDSYYPAPRRIDLPPASRCPRSSEPAKASGAQPTQAPSPQPAAALRAQPAGTPGVPAASAEVHPASAVMGDSCRMGDLWGGVLPWMLVILFAGLFLGMAMGWALCVCDGEL